MSMARAAFLGRHVLRASVVAHVSQFIQKRVRASEMSRPAFAFHEVPVDGRLKGGVFSEGTTAKGEVGRYGIEGRVIGRRSRTIRADREDPSRNAQ